MNKIRLVSSSPRRIRQNNAVAALQTLFVHGSLSRADLARKLQLNRSSSGHIVTQLASNNLVREVTAKDCASNESTGAGRPGILLELIPESAYFIGAEIGVEHITTLILDLKGTVCSYIVEPFDGPAVPVKQAVHSAVEQAFRDIPTEVLEKCCGFGLAAPAHINQSGFVKIAPLLGWADTDLVALAQQLIPQEMPVLVENDANAFAFCEAYLQRISAEQHVTFFMVIESGVGGGIVINGKLLRGGHGLAGEVGHMRMLGDDGAHNLEGSLGIRRLLSLYSDIRGNEEVNLQRFLRDVDDREPQAVVIAEEWAQHLAFAVVQICRVIAPDRFVLGGAVAALYPLVSARVYTHIQKLQPDIFAAPDIVVHKNAETGAALGAACLLHQRFMSLENELFTEKPEA